MGGHDHHHKPYTVPSHEIYKIENAPELMLVQQKLAEHGLKDPWLRNEVWRFERKQWKTGFSRTALYFLRGIRFAIPAFLVTIAVEKAFGLNTGHGGHDHHDEHGKH